MSTTSLQLSTNIQVGTQGVYVHVKAIDNAERKKIQQQSSSICCSFSGNPRKPHWCVQLHTVSVEATLRDRTLSPFSL